MRSRRALGIGAIVLAIVIAIVWFARGRGGHGAPSGQATEHGAATSKPTAPRARPHAALAGRDVAGTVVLDGNGVAGATVRIARLAGDTGRAPVVTDASGHFDLGTVPVGRYIVIAEKPQASGAFLAIDLRDPGVKADQLALVLHACTAVVHGTVRDSAGGAIGGARVARSLDALDGPAAETDAAGNYELCAVPEDTLLVASADGYAQDVAFVRISGRLRHDFLLGPEGEIEGRVVRADDHTPVGGAEVVVRPERPGDMFGQLTATSDDDGRFRIAGAGVGRYLVTATADGLATEHAVPTLAEVGKAQDDLVCELAPSMTVRGTVVEAGNPVAGARVTLESDVPSRERSPDAITAPDGTFTVDHVARGEYTPDVEGYALSAPKPIAVAASDVDDVRIEVESLASVSGRITHDGKPVEGAMVSDGRVRETTDVDGRYTLRGVAEGTHEIYAQSERIGAFAHGPKLTLARGEHRTGVDIELDLSGSISGTVVDQDGKPVGGVIVTFSLVGGRDFGRGTTAEDGTFTADTLSGGGDYKYDVRDGFGAQNRFEPASGGAFAPIHVADGHTRVTGVRIAIHHVATAVSGHVVGSHGEPLPDVIVRASYRRFGGATARTDESGAFLLTGVPELPFVLRASSVRGDAQLEDVTPGQRDVVIHIADPGTITGTLDGFDEQPEVFARGGQMMESAYQANVRGRAFTIRGVTPGTYVVTARTRTSYATSHVEVRAGANATLTLAARGFGTVTGVVRDAKTHQPVQGLRCYAFGAMSRAAPSDASGSFRIEHVPEGDIGVACMGPNNMGNQRVTVTAGQTATTEVLVQSRDDWRKSRGIPTTP